MKVFPPGCCKFEKKKAPRKASQKVRKIIFMAFFCGPITQLFTHHTKPRKASILQLYGLSLSLKNFLQATFFNMLQRANDVFLNESTRMYDTRSLDSSRFHIDSRDDASQMGSLFQFHSATHSSENVLRCNLTWFASGKNTNRRRA